MPALGRTGVHMRLGLRSSGVAGVLLAAGLLTGCGTGPATTQPHALVATLTGYSKTSPSNEVGVATSIRLTGARGLVLKRAIEALNVVPRAQCEENQLLFRLVIAQSTARSAATWTATAVLCPVPGLIEVGGTTYRATCSVIRLAASFLPVGTSGACYPTRT
jgi:hypothetical protein